MCKSGEHQILEKYEEEWYRGIDKQLKGRTLCVCHAQSNDGQAYIGVGKLNGQRRYVEGTARHRLYRDDCG